MLEYDEVSGKTKAAQDSNLARALAEFLEHRCSASWYITPTKRMYDIVIIEMTFAVIESTLSAV